MRALIIEDETRAREHMKNLIAEHFPALEVVGAVGSVKEATEWLLSNEDPDVIFMDVELSDGLSFDIFNKGETPRKNAEITINVAGVSCEHIAKVLRGIDYLTEEQKRDLIAKIFYDNTDTSGIASVNVSGKKSDTHDLSDKSLSPRKQ